MLFKEMTGRCLDFTQIRKIPDSSKVHSGKTKAYSEPDRKRVKVRVAPLGPFTAPFLFVGAGGKGQDCQQQQTKRCFGSGRKNHNPLKS
jgi:hypothetical protein